VKESDAIDFVRGTVAGRAAFHEIFFLEKRIFEVSVRDGRPEEVKSSSSAGVGLRLMDGGRMGFSYSSAMDEASLSGIVANALSAMRFLPPDSANAFAAPSGSFPSVPGIFDPALGSTGPRAKIDIASRMERASLECDVCVGIHKIAYEDESSTVRLVNSLGLDARASSSSAAIYSSVTATSNGVSETGWDYQFSRSLAGLMPEETGRRAAAEARGMLGARMVGTSRVQALLDRRVASQFLDLLSPSFLSENVRKNKSMLAGKTRSRIFSPSVNIFDDGLVPGAPGSFPFDGEGTPRGKTGLVRGGVLLGFLYDIHNARSLVAATTGNSARGDFRALPRLGISNLHIAPGESGLDGLRSEIREGIEVREVMGLHMANRISGDFSLGASGYWLENGRRAHPVRGVTIAGNIIELFGGISAVANDLVFESACSSPSMLVSALDIGGH
jgi:PmbA protein